MGSVGNGSSEQVYNPFEALPAWSKTEDQFLGQHHYADATHIGHARSRIDKYIVIARSQGLAEGAEEPWGSLMQTLLRKGVGFESVFRLELACL